MLLFSSSAFLRLAWDDSYNLCFRSSSSFSSYSVILLSVTGILRMSDGCPFPTSSTLEGLFSFAVSLSQVIYHFSGPLFVSRSRNLCLVFNQNQNEWDVPMSPFRPGKPHFPFFGGRSFSSRISLSIAVVLIDQVMSNLLLVWIYFVCALYTYSTSDLF